MRDRTVQKLRAVHDKLDDLLDEMRGVAALLEADVNAAEAYWDSLTDQEKVSESSQKADGDLTGSSLVLDDLRASIKGVETAIASIGIRFGAVYVK